MIDKEDLICQIERTNAEERRVLEYLLKSFPGFEKTTTLRNAGIGISMSVGVSKTIGRRVWQVEAFLQHKEWSAGLLINHSRSTFHLVFASANTAERAIDFLALRVQAFQSEVAGLLKGEL